MKYEDQLFKPLPLENSPVELQARIKKKYPITKPAQSNECPIVKEFYQRQRGA